jgi:hypothetical protein
MIEFFVTAAAITALPSLPSTAQAAPDLAQLLAANISLVDENYVVAATRPAIVAALRRGLASGHYANLEPSDLAARVSADMGAAF